MKKKNNQNKMNIAYLSRNIDDDTGHLLLKGIIHSAKQYNVNLFVLAGGQLGKSNNSIIYKLIDIDNFDGILTWASSDKDEHIKFYDKFKDFPLVSITLKIDNHPCITIDTYSGMKTAVNHLIQHHGYKKIAFIKGPEKHVYAQERFRAYTDSLKENGVAINENIITRSYEWGYQDGIDAINELLVEKKLKLKDDIEAIVSVNDNMAIGGVLELNRMGYNIPDDVAILSHDGRIEGKLMTPPLSSVKMPFLEQGKIAVKTLLDLILSDQTTLKVDILTSKFEIEESCGCNVLSTKNREHQTFDINLSDDALQFFKNKKNKNIKECDSSALKEKIIKELTFALMPYMQDFFITDDIIRDFIAELLYAFCEDIEDGASIEFLKKFKDILTKIIESQGSMEIWQDFISILKNNIFSNFECEELLIRSNIICEQARILIMDLMQKSFQKRISESERFFNGIRLIGNSLFSANSIKEMLHILIKFLPNLKFKELYISLYENPVDNYDKLPEYSNLILAYIDGTVNLIDNNIKYKTKSVLPEEYLKREDIIQNIIVPLAYNKIEYGFICIINSTILRNFFSILSDQISSVLYNIYTNDEKNRQNIVLENTLDMMHNKADIVSGESQRISDRTEDVSSSMEELAANIRQIDIQVKQIINIINNAVNTTARATEAIQLLSEESNKITELINIINDIAQKTNILSLNASIQAAHAKESGRGFTVVSKEIKNLSFETMKSTSIIIKTIESIQKNAGNTFEIIKLVVENINKINNLSTIIQNSISEHVTSTNDIANKLTETAQGSKEIFAQVKELALKKSLNNE
ncbi:MAG: substrate-binding domain-containing protein [Spirochaetes bacterium]|nr:substrate-binding domain-containing protein [Spirochaetota bacterium]